MGNRARQFKKRQRDPLPLPDDKLSSTKSLMNKKKGGKNSGHAVAAAVKPGNKLDKIIKTPPATPNTADRKGKAFSKNNTKAQESEEEMEEQEDDVVNDFDWDDLPDDEEVEEEEDDDLLALNDKKFGVFNEEDFLVSGLLVNAFGDTLFSGLTAFLIHTFLSLQEPEEGDEEEEDGEDDNEEKDDDEEEEGDEDQPKVLSMFGSDGSSDEEEDEDEEELEVERQARELDAQNQEDEELAEEEMRMAIEQREKFVLPSRAGATGSASDEEGEDEDEDDEEGGEKDKSVLSTLESNMNTNPDLTVVQTRIQEIIRVLNNFSELREEGRSRSEYISQLISDIAIYYGYNEFLAEKLFHMFPVGEVKKSNIL